MKTPKGVDVMRLKRTPFIVKSLPYGGDGKMRQHAIVGCCACSATDRYVYTGTLNVEFIRKHFEKVGWEIDGSSALCPVCVERNKKQRRGESPGLKIFAQNPAIIEAEKHFTKPVTPIKSLSELPTALSETKDAEVIPMAITQVTLPAPPPSVTTAHRALMRKAIAGNYNEELCCYENGVTDKSIADEIGIPVQWVSDYRDVAFGPLKSSKEIDALLEELEYVRKEIKAVDERYHTEMKACKQLIANADERIAELSKKMGFK